ncbi:MAG TPA: cell division FtsA domain-containing protein [Candidatus Dojkabacteria bacterium]|nr:cell division FtsA domain-containing protein [Candidatus Dojkabacteria bacterium]HRO64982.1 cell division FtsA domain-containing protein [Candidatus Dojkabacteria bacterium]HRP51807.1 cell division FtsA domain-containing protein [Candidatus Dojkabacteria bacterium]
MKLPFLSKTNKTDNEVLLALDVGTEFVKAVIFTVEEGDSSIKVLGYGRSRQHGSSMKGAMVINIEHVVNACDKAIGEALNHADEIMSKELGVEYVTPAPEKALLGIAGELVKGVTIIADYSREEPDVKIEQKEIDEVITSIKEYSFNQAINDISEETGIETKRLQEINTKINATYIDGVQVDRPLGMTGENISYRVFSTFAPSLHLNSLKEIASQLGLEILSIEVEPYAVARAVKDAKSEKFSAVIIDIGGGTTDIAVVDRGSVIATKMFAYGGKVFTKRISNKLKVQIEDAEKIKIDYSNGAVNETQSRAIREMLTKDCLVWAQGVELSLSEIEDIDSYPTVFYLCGGGSGLPEIKESLQEYAWLQTLPFAKHPKIEYLYPKQLEDINDVSRSITGPEDIAPLALARMYFELDKK